MYFFFVHTILYMCYSSLPLLAFLLPLFIYISFSIFLFLSFLSFSSRSFSFLPHPAFLFPLAFLSVCSLCLFYYFFTFLSSFLLSWSFPLLSLSLVSVSPSSFLNYLCKAHDSVARVIGNIKTKAVAMRGSELTLSTKDVLKSAVAKAIEMEKGIVNQLYDVLMNPDNHVDSAAKGLLQGSAKAFAQ